LKLPNAEKLINVYGKVTLDNNHIPQCGPFSIELRVWDRDPDSMRSLSKNINLDIGQIRKDLDEACGVSIYRDDFRVLPYGESHNDWLRLDLRRVQNPTLRLSNNQILGYIMISADTNPNLRDQSNREGLMSGSALDDLKSSVLVILNEIETRRYKNTTEKEPNTT